MTSAERIISGQVGDRQGLPDKRQEEGSNDLLETSAVGCYGKGVQGWTVSKSVGGKQLVMNLTESCLWRVEAELTPEQLLGGFSSSH